MGWHRSGAAWPEDSRLLMPVDRAKMAALTVLYESCQLTQNALRRYRLGV